LELVLLLDAAAVLFVVFFFFFFVMAEESCPRTGDTKSFSSISAAAAVSPVCSAAGLSTRGGGFLCTTAFTPDTKDDEEEELFFVPPLAGLCATFTGIFECLDAPSFTSIGWQALRFFPVPLSSACAASAGTLDSDSGSRVVFSFMGEKVRSIASLITKEAISVIYE
jgi:hypothetical protein